MGTHDMKHCNRHVSVHYRCYTETRRRGGGCTVNICKAGLSLVLAHLWGHVAVQQPPSYHTWWGQECQGQWEGQLTKPPLTGIHQVHWSRLILSPMW